MPSNKGSNQSIYLDHASTTPLDGEVLAAMRPYFCEEFGNASSQHAYGMRAANAVVAARDEMAVALGISPHELYFTSCGTESDNLGIKGISLAAAERGKHIVVSAVEHPAVIQSALDLKEFGFEVTFVYPDENGVVSPQTVQNCMRADTVLVAVMSANNETGVIQPVKEICAAVHAMGAYLWCDCVQTAGVLPVSEFPADGFAISAHKFYGPKGVGAACIKRGVRFRRQLAGGQQERGMRGGTLNTPGIAGMACALSLSLKRAAHDNEYVASLRNAFESIILSSVPDVFINGGAAQRLPSHSNISFCGCDAQNLVFALDMRGVACSAGAACSSGASKPSHVLQAMNVGEQRLKSAVRFSFGKNNTVRQVECAAEAVIAAVKAIRG